MSFKYTSNRTKIYVKENQSKKRKMYSNTAQKHTKYVKKNMLKNQNLNLENFKIRLYRKQIHDVFKFK